jgi:adenine-specific DNA methylase
MTGAKSVEYSRFLSFHGRNPDVLNSIANLSNDEVFTPPEFANKMLDTLEKAWAESNNGENIWSNPDLKFLDPFTKSGVFLREIASRLIEGLESEIPDLQDRVDHILTKQVFGIATTHLTSLMARRSLYCSKKANGKHSVTKKFKDESGNIWFKPLPHTWGKGTVRELTMDESGKEVEPFVDGKCKYCGASKRDFDREDGLELHAYGLIHTDDPKKWIGEVFGSEMQFDVIIGNPPYQLADGGFGSSARPIYDSFVSKAKLLDPKFLVMVIPSRWFTGGKGLDSFRSEMVNDQRIKVLEDFFDAADVFPGIDLSGGVCYFLWDTSYQGPCDVTNNVGGKRTTQTRFLRTSDSDKFVRFNEAVSVLDKVLAKKLPSFAAGVSAGAPFGLATNHPVRFEPGGDSLPVFAYPKNGFVKRKEVTKGQELINAWKVMVASAYGERGPFPYLVLGKPFLSPPGSISTATYVLVFSSEDRLKAENVASYVRTKFFRFLVLMNKNTQHANRGVYELVPSLDFSIPWTDERLFDFFELTDAEVAFIDEMIRPMEVPNG